jgi:hypothetical protein
MLLNRRSFRSGEGDIRRRVATGPCHFFNQGEGMAKQYGHKSISKQLFNYRVNRFLDKMRTEYNIPIIIFECGFYEFYETKVNVTGEVDVVTRMITIKYNKHATLEEITTVVMHELGHFVDYLNNCDLYNRYFESGEYETLKHIERRAWRCCLKLVKKHNLKICMDSAVIAAKSYGLDLKWFKQRKVA